MNKNITMQENVMTKKNVVAELARATKLVAMISVISLVLGALLNSTSQGSPTSGEALSAVPAQVSATTGQKVSAVRSVELIKAKGGVIVRTHIDGKLQFTHQIIPNKDGKPYRIILDCLNADHKLGKTKFTNLPKSIVTSIRSSQFAVKPERICRLVLDLEKEALYRVTQGPTYVDIFVTDKTERNFSNWSSIGTKNVSPVKASGAKSNITISATAKASQPAKAVAVNEKKTVGSAINVSEKAFAKPSGKTVASKVATEKSGSNVAISTKSTANTKAKPAGPTVAAKTSRTNKAVVAKPKSESAKTTSQTVLANKKSAQNSPSIPVSKTAPSTKNAVKNAVKENTKAGAVASKPVAEKSKANKVEKTHNRDKNSKTATLAVSNKTTGKKSNKVSTKKSVKSVPTTLKIVTRGKSETLKAVKTDKKTEKTTVLSNVANAASRPPENSRSRSENANTAKFRRVAERVAKLKGTRIAEFPKRLVIKYNSYNTDDPFATLIDKNKVNNNPSKSLIPNVENLLMVGVLQGKNNKNRGLFEDQDGRGYILKPGDKVENGTVLKVTSEKAYFQIFEYGWSRTVSLQLHE